MFAVLLLFFVYYAQATAPEIVGILGLDALHVNKKDYFKVIPRRISRDE